MKNYNTKSDPTSRKLLRWRCQVSIATRAMNFTIRMLHDHQSTEKGDEKYRIYDCQAMNKLVSIIDCKLQSIYGSSLSANSKHQTVMINAACMAPFSYVQYLLAIHCSIYPEQRHRLFGAKTLRGKYGNDGILNVLQPSPSPGWRETLAWPRHGMSATIIDYLHNCRSDP